MTTKEWRTLLVEIFFGGMMLWQAQDLISSIKELNVKVAVILERVESHERRIQSIESIENVIQNRRR